LKIFRTISASLSLLTRRDRRLLAISTIIQMSMSLLDLVGILLLGVVTSLAISTISNSTPPEIVMNSLRSLGINTQDIVALAAWLAVIAGIILISKSLINLILTRRVLTFLANRQALVSGRLAAGLLSKPLVQLQQRSSQETVYSLTTGTYNATLIVLGQGVVAVSELTLLITLAVGLFAVSPVVTVFTVLYFFGIGLLLQRLISRWAVRIGDEAKDADIRSMESVQEALRTYREMFVAHRRSSYVERFQILRWQSARVQADMAFLSLVPKYIFEAALVIGAGLLAASQILTRDLPAAVAVIAIFLAAGSRVVPSMLRLHGSGLAVLGAAGQADPTFKLAGELGLIKPQMEHSFGIDSVNAIEVRDKLYSGHPEFVPSVVAEKLAITYPGNNNASVRDVSIYLAAGQSLGIVGPTGSGKSSLADLLLGVLAPDTGKVLIGGLPPIDAIAAWPGGISYVPQEVVLVNSTVRENVALGLPFSAIDDEWVWEALERAHLAEFLRRGRQGLDTVVGEHGFKLSGGQRQRLGMARALYSHPKLLVLDEATSALDAETEKSISNTMATLEGEVTTIIIAHRLATIKKCDLIIYLEQGEMTAAGSFDELRSFSEGFSRQAEILGL
jgi:ABC-type multidrug transport system fused ATPase/permease subunit